MSENPGYSSRELHSGEDLPSALMFFISKIMHQLNTVTLVQVKSVTNAGGISAVGTVSVVPLVQAVMADGTLRTHQALNNVPYFRIQGGANAVILDPQVGDIGLCAFASRDISSVKKSKTISAPGSLRTYDWADGLYLGGFLNGIPTQYIAFAAGGITVVSPTKVVIQAPEVDVNASTKVVVISPDIELQGTVAVTGSLTASGTLTGTTNVVGGGKSLNSHTHSGVTTGSGNTGAPV
jgi:phage baseplate assembly protein gpV